MTQFADLEAIVGRDNVSRETREALNDFAVLMEKWSKSINLVAPTTTNSTWSRHILDSAQISGLFEDEAEHWCDLGTGGGLPGLVVSILRKERHPDTKFTLVESDRRKASFLKVAVARYDLNARILAERIESTIAQRADVVSARALAPLDRLLSYVHRHSKEGTVALLHKGRTHRQEIEDAKTKWNFDVNSITSKIDPESRILRISDLNPKDLGS